VKALGIRYLLPVFGALAEVFDNGETALRCDAAYERFTPKNQLVEATTHGYSLRRMLGCKGNVREFALRHGRPHGTIWG
jgi:hypothetical protein